MSVGPTEKLFILGELDTVLNRAFKSDAPTRATGGGRISAVSVHSEVLAGNAIRGVEGQRRHLQCDLADAEGHHADGHVSDRGWCADEVGI